MTRIQMAAAHPTYVLPSEVTDDGWYRGPGKETDDECRARAKRVLERVRATASGLKDSRNVLVVAHYDFISAFLDAILVPETTGEFARWRHHQHRSHCGAHRTSYRRGGVHEGQRCATHLRGRRGGALGVSPVVGYRRR